MRVSLSRLFAIGLSVGILLTNARVTAQQAPAGGSPADNGPKIVEVERLRDNLYVMKGGGGVSAVFITQNNGVVVVDTKLPGWGTPLLEKIREITDKPVTTVINTHVHPDHTSGNVEFPSSVTFIAHANTKTNMEKLDLFKGDNARFLPSRTFEEKLSLFSGADQIDLYYFGRGGTDGDIWVELPAHRIIFAGDAFSNRTVTIIDQKNGGNATEFVATLSTVFSELKGVDTVVTGHGPVLPWSELGRFVQFNRDFQTWVRAQKQAGKTIEQTAAEYRHPAQYSDYDVRPASAIQLYVQAIYDEAPAN